MRSDPSSVGLEEHLSPGDLEAGEAREARGVREIGNQAAGSRDRPRWSAWDAMRGRGTAAAIIFTRVQSERQK
ncbi:hypothetical protein COCOBI_02-0950 [Coccomyxa sp. Obi]|nr:hypothetical protein COCOBI_02-0950 [Coccomyxa sp. Obi]